MKNVLVKAIKGVDNPADLGTKALSRDKIRKYLKALGYKGDFLDDEEQQVRRTKNGMKTVSVSMIAKIVAILMSEGICVEGAFTVVREQNPWHELSIMSCWLICIVMFCMVSMFMPAAVWDQAFRFGEEEKGREKKFGEKKRKGRMADEGNMPQEMMSLRPPNEPTPTEEGEETMEKRAKELKQQALESKAARQMALEKALQEKALEEEKAAEEKENPAGSGALQPQAAVESGSTLEKKDKEDEDEDDSESSEEEQSSSDEIEEENPTGSGKQQSVIFSDVPAVEEAVTTRKDVPAVEEAELQTQEEESKEEKRERLSREMDEHFKGVLKTLAGKVESSKNYSATRTVLSLWNSLTVSFMTPSDLQEDDLRDALLLAEINRETLDTLDRQNQKDRAEKFRILLRAKAQYLEAERSRKNEEIARKLGWIQQKMTEVRAEENALEKMTNFHESIEEYVTTGLRELRNLQKSNEAQEMEWSGLDFDMTKEGGDNLSSMTFYEKLFSERLNPSEASPITELETSLKEFESVQTIDLEAEGRTSAPADAARPAMGPPDVPMKKEPVGTPKTKPMPRPLHKGDGREESKKEERMLREKKKREEEAAASAAMASYEEAAKRPKKDGQELIKDLINSETVPREYLEVEITQDVWSLLGLNSRTRILEEKKTAERCYFCSTPGHRAFACSSMLRLACAWGQVTGQPKYGGWDRKHSLWCSSCALANSMIAATRGEDMKKVSGWYVHTRSACHSKDKCPLKPDDELLKMSAAELLRHLKEKGMFGKEEQELQEKEKEKIVQ